MDIFLNNREKETFREERDKKEKTIQIILMLFCISIIQNGFL